MDLRFNEMFLSAAPYLIMIVAWIVAIVFAARMLRRGDKPERFLLLGTCLMLAGSLVSIAVAILNPLLIYKLTESGINRVSIATVFGAISIVRACISLAGIVILVLAFWQKFKTGHATDMNE